MGRVRIPEQRDRILREQKPLLCERVRIPYKTNHTKVTKCSDTSQEHNFHVSKDSLDFPCQNELMRAFNVDWLCDWIDNKQKKWSAKTGGLYIADQTPWSPLDAKWADLKTFLIWTRCKLEKRLLSYSEHRGANVVSAILGTSHTSCHITHRSIAVKNWRLSLNDAWSIDPQRNKTSTRVNQADLYNKASDRILLSMTRAVSWRSIPALDGKGHG